MAEPPDAAPSRRWRLDPADPARVHVAIEGRGEVVVPLDLVESIDLPIEGPLDAEQERAVLDAAARVEAEQRARGILDRRPRSIAQLADDLARRGTPSSIATETAERLAETGLLDERAYARAVIREATRRRPAGPALLRARLASRRLRPETIDTALAEHAAATSEAEASTTSGSTPLDDLVTRSLAKWHDLSAPTRRRRLASLLARRGYEPEAVESIVDRHLGPALDDAPPID